MQNAETAQPVAEGALMECFDALREFETDRPPPAVDEALLPLLDLKAKMAISATNTPTIEATIIQMLELEVEESAFLGRSLLLCC